MNILVTGAAGHLGSHLIPALRAESFGVTGLDLVPPKSPLPDGCRFTRADLANAAEVKKTIAGADCIVHCASIHPWKQYTDDQYLDANIKGTWHLYAAAAELGIGRIVLTSSIAAVGYGFSPSEWPVGEDSESPLSDLYSLTKHTQEDIARLFAARGKIRTIALRPPAFMPKPDLETVFLLTGAFALADDIAAAHVAAVKVTVALQETPELLRAFEAFFVTNKLPYTAADAALRGPSGDPKPLVKKHWPHAYDWLIAKGYQGCWLPAVYDLAKAKRLLGWEPKHNFDEWFEEHQEA